MRLNPPRKGRIEPSVCRKSRDASPFAQKSLALLIFIGTVYVSAGKDSTLADALPLKAYLVQDGICYAETVENFIYWSEQTALTFAADLEWSEATVGWGNIQKNQSVEGRTMALAGKKFTHGIGIHATSSITMAIPAGADKFLAVAGCDLEMSGDQTMMFIVYIDGVEADRSSLIRIGQHYVFDLDIPDGAKEIRLFVHEGRHDGNVNDHADWAVAGFFENR